MKALSKSFEYDERDGNNFNNNNNHNHSNNNNNNNHHHHHHHTWLISIALDKCGIQYNIIMYLHSLPGFDKCHEANR